MVVVYTSARYGDSITMPRSYSTQRYVRVQGRLSLRTTAIQKPEHRVHIPKYYVQVFTLLANVYTKRAATLSSTYCIPFAKKINQRQIDRVRTILYMHTQQRTLKINKAKNRNTRYYVKIRSTRVFVVRSRGDGGRRARPRKRNYPFDVITRHEKLQRERYEETKAQIVRP